MEVITLPNKVKIETEEQIRDLTNHQKVEVLFNSAVMNEVFCSYLKFIRVLGKENNKKVITEVKNTYNKDKIIAESLKAMLFV